MKLLIIGAGRMGIRHATGALQISELTEICLTDISEDSLERARVQLSSDNNFNKLKICRSEGIEGVYNFVIVSSTARDRMATISAAMKVNPSFILLEKPLGQSIEEVNDLMSFFDGKDVEVSVNLNMRMYPFVKQLKNDLQEFPQFSGPKSINFQGGTLGIGANGIHYLDLLFFLLDADSAELVSGEIDKELIPSGRGPEFGDFGGWACIKFYDSAGNFLGRSIISLSATSTVFGGWDIIGSHGRIRLNELESERIDVLRKAESNLPLNRYAGDYQLPETVKIESPFLGDLTKNWIEGLIKTGVNSLPTINQSLKVHKLMFDWLSLSKTHKDVFPIT